jgi:small subunit ribosomal protein S8
MVSTTTTRRFSSQVSDPVADLLTRIRNANLAYKDETLAPVSKLSGAILDILVAEGFLDGYDRDGDGVDAAFKIRLKYGPKRERTISGLRRISKPGRRIYRGRTALPRVRGGLGIAIVSTSQGVMSDRQARAAGHGGEVLCIVS